nr:E115 [uncultured bacterium]ART38457.1 G411 [uncultured bacterium]
MEPVGQHSRHRTVRTMRDVVEQEPLMLGLMFPQGQGAWTASLIPIETRIEWNYLEELAVLADRGGLDYLFMGNGYYAKGGYGGIGRVRAAGLDATTVAMALASVTQRLLLISTIHTAYHAVHPLFFAKMGATLDYISNGRWGPNLVAGISELNARHFGTAWFDHDERYVFADEFTTVLKRLWSDPEPVTFQGQYVKTESAWMEPKPTRLPLMVNAGVSDVGLEFAARHCDWVFDAFGLDGDTPETSAIRARIARIKGFGRRHGKELKVAVCVYVICRETEAEAERAFAEIATHADLEAIQAMRSPGALVDPKGSEAFRRMSESSLGNAAIWNMYKVQGNPEQVAEGLAALKAQGIDCLNLVFCNYVSELRFFVDRVLPLLQQAGLRLEQNGAPRNTGELSQTERD